MQSDEDGGEVATSKGFVVDFFEGLLVGEKAEDWVDRGLKKQQVTGKKQCSDDFDFDYQSTRREPKKSPTNKQSDKYLPNNPGGGNQQKPNIQIFAYH